jgi:hypothetical protein
MSRLEKAEQHLAAAKADYDARMWWAKYQAEQMQASLTRAMDAKAELDLAQQEYSNAGAGETFIIVTQAVSLDIEQLRKDFEWARRFVGPLS